MRDCQNSFTRFSLMILTALGQITMMMVEVTIGIMTTSHTANRATTDTLALVAIADSLFLNISTTHTVSAQHTNPTTAWVTWTASYQATAAVPPSTKADTTPTPRNSLLHTAHPVHLWIHLYALTVQPCPAAKAQVVSCQRAPAPLDITSHGAQRQSTSWADSCFWPPLSCLQVSSSPIGGGDGRFCSVSSAREAAATGHESHPNPEARAVTGVPPRRGEPSQRPVHRVEVLLLMILVMEVFSPSCVLCLHDNERLVKVVVEMSHSVISTMAVFVLVVSMYSLR